APDRGKSRGRAVRGAHRSPLPAPSGRHRRVERGPHPQARHGAGRPPLRARGRRWPGAAPEQPGFRAREGRAGGTRRLAPGRPSELTVAPLASLPATAEELDALAAVPTDLLIGDSCRPARSGRRLAVEDPATGATICTVADASSSDCMKALCAAA